MNNISAILEESHIIIEQQSIHITPHRYRKDTTLKFGKKIKDNQKYYE